MTPEWQMISCPGGKTAWKLNSDVDLDNERFRGIGNGIIDGNSIFSIFGGGKYTIFDFIFFILLRPFLYSISLILSM